MPESATWKRARKGTRSCTECRRRKIRCIRLPKDNQICRGCEERLSECVAQEYSSQPSQTQRLPSKYRISQLESKVASLSEVIRNIELKLGHQPTEIPETNTDQILETDDSDNDPSGSDVLTANQPSHLRSLFQNDWLSMDTQRQNEQLQHRKTKASTHVLDIAREALQRLIPSKDEVLDIARSVSRWLILHHTLLPQPFAVKSQQEMLDMYDDMHKPDVHAISLASWLLTVAITAQQIPQKPSSPTTQLSTCQRWLDFSRAVSNTVESTILSHDRLICTTQGLGAAMHFFRFQMSQGNFQKAWIRLRHYTVIAELMGLPKAFQAIQLNGAIRGDEEEKQLQKAQLWELICAADRLFGMILNLPPGTKRYQQTNGQALVVDDVVQPRVYLARLTDVATKIQHIDELNTTQGLSAELYASALDLARELRNLASQAPRAWWVRDAKDVEADHIVQFLHYCIVMRVHLPFAMRQNPGEEYFYSRFACVEACKSVIQRYRFLRETLPPGFFLAQILDLQAFIATVVLLLTTHSSLPTDRFNLRINKAQVESVVAQVVMLMGEKSNYLTGSSVARNGVTTICSLSRLLQQDDTSASVQELTLKVPLLGKLHIQRNVRKSQSPLETINPQSTQVVPEMSFHKLNEQTAPQPLGPPLLFTDSYVEATLPTQEEGQWDNFSWSIENYQENFFQDALRAESLDQFAL